MTQTEYNNYQKAAVKGTMKDELNPAFILSLTHNDLLVKIANGDMDVKALAALTLAGRGYSTNGEWVGIK